MPTLTPTVEAKTRFTWLMPAISGAVVLVLILTGALWFARHRGQGFKPERLAAVPNDGLPHTPAELNDWYVEPPAGQNAATFFSQGFNALRLRHPNASNVPLFGHAHLPPLGTPLSPLLKSSLSAFLQANREALQFFDQGSGLEHCRYPVDLSQGFATVLPHLTHVKGALQLLELAAISHADNRDGTQAAHDILMALALTRSLAAEPALLSQLMRATHASIALAALEQTINLTSLPRESLSQLSKAFQQMEDYDARGEGFNRAMVAERTTDLSLLETPQQFRTALNLPDVNLPAAERQQILARLEKPNQLKEERLYIENTFQQLLAARQAAFPERFKAGELIQQRAIQAANQKLVISAFLLPGLTTPPAKEAACLAQSRLGLTAVALEQFRGSHEGRYPDALSELTPDYLAAAPIDPFDGQSLRYRKEAAGYILYSIGPDLNDDSGGRLTAKDGGIVFAVVKPTGTGY